MSTDRIRWDRATPPRALSVDEITRMLDPWLGGRSVTSAELMSGGLTNRNIHLRIAGRPAECVLRVYDGDPAACGREVAVLGMIGREIPVPRVLYADDAPESGPPCAVLSVVEGISLYTLRSLGLDDDVSDAAFDAGRLLARIGGYPGPATTLSPIAERVERAMRAPLFAGRVDAGLRQGLAELTSEWQPRLEDVARIPSLMHGDFNSPNIFVRQSENGWRVSGILDWEFARQDSPFCDIGNFLRYHRVDRPRYEPAFSAGLREGGMALPPDWLMLARLADLPDLCALLGRQDIPDAVVAELILLIRDIVGRV